MSLSPWGEVGLERCGQDGFMSTGEKVLGFPHLYPSVSPVSKYLKSSHRPQLLFSASRTLH